MAPMTPAEIIVSMQMTLSYSAELGMGFLFDGWTVKGPGQFIGTLVATVVLVLVTETLSFLIQQRLVQKDKTRSPYYSAAYFLLRFLNYTEMLVCMTFNIWLILALTMTSAICISV